MSKPGRPRKYASKMTVTIGVRVPPDMADAMYLLAHRISFDVSAETRAFWQRVLAKHTDVLSENCESSRTRSMLLM